jgi:hypothetical protein
MAGRKLEGIKTWKSNQKGKRNNRRKMAGVECIQVLILENVEISNACAKRRSHLA